MTSSELAEDIRVAVLGVIRLLVDKPEAIVITHKEASGTILISINVAGEDRGKIIGSGGRNVDSLRVLAHAIAGKQKMKCLIEAVS
ncbi:MAG: KH domain-containing protein [Dehalococcoidia bacterium]|nr:KH domain-containing protein [Dehalococcoidia bacterium]